MWRHILLTVGKVRIKNELYTLKTEEPELTLPGERSKLVLKLCNTLICNLVFNDVWEKIRD